MGSVRHLLCEHIFTFCFIMMKAGSIHHGRAAQT